MKVLVVNPPAYENKDYIREGRCMQTKSSWAALWAPLSLTYIAAIMREEGYEVRLIDCIAEKINKQNLLEIVKKFLPNLVVLNTAFPSIKGDMDMAELIKKHDPNIKIIAIGMFPTILEDKCMNTFNQIDFGVVGEPEWVVKNLVNSLDEKKPIENIKGLLHRKDGKVYKNEPQDFKLNDVEKLPIPARDLLKNECYILPINRQKFTLLSIGRGCPHSCIFCVARVYYGSKFRKRSIESIIKEIKECQDKQGISNFLFWGESFTIDPKYGEQICDAIIQNGLKISWSTTSRVDTLNDTLLMKMKQAGCILLGLGIESSNQKIIDTANKNTTLSKIKSGIEMVKKAKINSMGHFIFGLPGETKETAKETIKFACKCGVEFAQFYCAVPYPKTELGRIAYENNWVETDDYSQFDLNKSIMGNGNLTPQQIKKFRDLAYRKFYFRPKMLIQTLKEVNSVRSFFSSLDFLGWIKSK